MQIAQDKVNISGIVKQDGKLDPDLETDSVSLTIVGIQEETARQPTQRYLEREGVKYKIARDLFLHLQVLITFNFVHHIESMKFLSAVLQFFQGKPVFERDNTLQYNLENIDKLSVKLMAQSFEQQNHLWGALGAKYMPSLLYKVSLLNIQNNRIAEEVPTVKEINHALQRN